ncbi:MAG TPA: ABC transporter ATP-binding protein [Acidimicrobiia bacterium]|nr:ABC transporter ATP-binding protein [Acidimicrobiia bacterium]
MGEIELRNVSLSFPNPKSPEPNVVYENFSIKIEKGSFTFLLGPSGCGKSTFLNIINGLLTPTSADAVLVDGQDIRRHPELTRRMGYVFQGPRLLPWKTLRENVEFGLKGLGVQPKERWPELIEKYFAMAGLSKFMDHYPSQVSGGMQQRAAIVRAWVNEPEILLMDEPFSHLDEITAAELRSELVSLWAREEERRTIVFVTHNISEAAQMASDVVVLTPTPSQICYRRTIDIPWPRTSTDDAVFEIEKELRHVFAERAGVRV